MVHFDCLRFGHMLNLEGSIKGMEMKKTLDGMRKV